MKSTQGPDYGQQQHRPAHPVGQVERPAPGREQPFRGRRLPLAARHEPGLDFRKLILFILPVFGMSLAAGWPDWANFRL
jgi:hypothetical protein